MSRCKFPSCDKHNQGGGFCRAHGGGKRCKHPECQNIALSKGKCREHDERKKCQHENCEEHVIRGNNCPNHGGVKECNKENCRRAARPNGRCAEHGGGNETCKEPDCDKDALKNGFCSSHGGSNKCLEPDCEKIALPGGKCRQHGGGKRCCIPDCEERALQGGKCKDHGGGRRCQVDGCDKYDKGGGKCNAHGGGRRCKVDGCTKFSRGGGKCTEHGGGRRTTQNSAKENIKKGDEDDMASMSGESSVVVLDFEGRDDADDDQDEDGDGKDGNGVVDSDKVSDSLVSKDERKDRKRKRSLGSLGRKETDDSIFAENIDVEDEDKVEDKVEDANKVENEDKVKDTNANAKKVVLLQLSDSSNDEQQPLFIRSRRRSKLNPSPKKLEDQQFNVMVSESEQDTTKLDNTRKIGGSRDGKKQDDVKPPTMDIIKKEKYFASSERNDNELGDVVNIDQDEPDNQDGEKLSSEDRPDRSEQGEADAKDDQQMNDNNSDDHKNRHFEAGLSNPVTNLPFPAPEVSDNEIASDTFSKGQKREPSRNTSIKPEASLNNGVGKQISFLCPIDKVTIVNHFHKDGNKEGKGASLGSITTEPQLSSLDHYVTTNLQFQGPVKEVIITNHYYSN